MATLLTSRFGVAGTMLGLALSAVVITVVADTLKFYLARVPGAVTSIPGGFKKKSLWGRFLLKLRLPFSKFSSIPPARRRSLLVGSLVAGVISFLVGLVIVTGVELSVGKDLSCWVWNDCPAQSSADGGNASETSTLPSILGGSQSVSSIAPQVAPSAPQQQPTPPPSSSGKPSAPSVSEQPSTPPSQQQSPSDEYQQQSEHQQQSEYQQQGEYRQQSLSSSSETQEQQSPSSESEGQQPTGSHHETPTPPSSP